MARRRSSAAYPRPETGGSLGSRAVHRFRSSSRSRAAATGWYLALRPAQRGTRARHRALGSLATIRPPACAASGARPPARTLEEPSMNRRPQPSASSLGTVALCAVALLLGSVALAQDPSAAPTPPPAAAANDYDADAAWLCRPGAPGRLHGRPHDDGRRRRRQADARDRGRPIRSAPIDCFYVYPTVSPDADRQQRHDRRSRGAGRRAPAVRALRLAVPRCSRRCTGRSRSTALRAA